MENITESASSVTANQADLALLAELRARWPILGQPKPLKIGIRKDIRAALDGISGVRISRAVIAHIASPEYQKALAAGGARYNLAGEPDGEVTAKEQRHAQAVLDGKARPPTTKTRKKPKRVKAKDKQPLDSRPQSQAEAPPPNIPTAAPPEPVAPAPVEAAKPLSARPTLKLKPKAGAVTTVTVTRKEPKP